MFFIFFFGSSWLSLQRSQTHTWILSSFLLHIGKYTLFTHYMSMMMMMILNGAENEKKNRKQNRKHPILFPSFLIHELNSFMKQYKKTRWINEILKLKKKKRKKGNSNFILRIEKNCCCCCCWHYCWLSEARIKKQTHSHHLTNMIFMHLCLNDARKTKL